MFILACEQELYFRWQQNVSQSKRQYDKFSLVKKNVRPIKTLTWQISLLKSIVAVRYEFYFTTLLHVNLYTHIINLCSRFSPVVTNFSRQMTRVHLASQRVPTTWRTLASTRDQTENVKMYIAVLYIKYLVGGGNGLFDVKFIDEYV